MVSRLTRDDGRAMGGAIRIESVEGAGSSFTIRLPLGDGRVALILDVEALLGDTVRGRGHGPVRGWENAP